MPRFLATLLRLLSTSAPEFAKYDRSQKLPLTQASGCECRRTCMRRSPNRSLRCFNVKRYLCWATFLQSQGRAYVEARGPDCGFKSHQSCHCWAHSGAVGQRYHKRTPRDNCMAHSINSIPHNNNNEPAPECQDLPSEVAIDAFAALPPRKSVEKPWKVRGVCGSK